MFKTVPAKLPIPASRIKYSFNRPDDFRNVGDKEPDTSHIHYLYEIYVNLSDDVSFLVNNRLYNLKSGDVIMSSPSDVRVCILNSLYAHEHFCLRLDCNSPNQLTDYFDDDDFGNVFKMSGDGKKALLSILCSLRRADEKGASQAARTSHISEIIELISAQCHYPWRHEYSEIRVPAEIQRVLDYINDNLTETRHIRNVVDNTYVSATTLSRWFRKYINVTPHEYIEATKLSHAIRLLDEGMSVTNVCTEAGFSGCSHFIAVFKKKFGLTPSRYARDSKGPE